MERRTLHRHERGERCTETATTQIAWCGIDDGLTHISGPLCDEHGEELQPAETVAVYEVFSSSLQCVAHAGDTDAFEPPELNA